VEIYCVITTALLSRGGSAVVSVHPAAASAGQVCGSLAVKGRFGGLACRSGGSLWEEN